MTSDQKDPVEKGECNTQKDKSQIKGRLTKMRKALDGWEEQLEEFSTFVVMPQVK